MWGVCLAAGAWRERREPVRGAGIGRSGELMAGHAGQGKPGLCELPAVAEERTQCCKLSVEKGSAPSNPISTT